MHHHTILDSPEKIGTIIGTALGAVTALVKKAFLITLFGFSLDIHDVVQQVIEGVIICIPTAAVGAVVGYYVTKALKKIDKK